MLDPLDRSVAALSEEISALMDGELPSEEVKRVAERWPVHERARADWYTFHLIGDILRSEDLASTAIHDSRFLNSLRERLVHEPVVLAPKQLPTQSNRRWTPPWHWSSAAAMGSVVIGVTLWAGGILSPEKAPERLASPAFVTSTSTLGLSETTSLEPAPLEHLWQGNLVRDAQIDRYLAAHQQFVGTSALGVPSGFIRNVAVDSPSGR